jgi:hypothetical protein
MLTILPFSNLNVHLSVLTGVTLWKLSTGLLMLDFKTARTNACDGCLIGGSPFIVNFAKSIFSFPFLKFNTHSFIKKKQS